MTLLIHNCCLSGEVQMIEEEETERQERENYTDKSMKAPSFE
jgi:hypothetical protein